MKIGQMNKLEVSNFSPFGAYLNAQTGKRKDNVLLPSKQIPKGLKEGDILNVFIYKDSENRLIATTKKPLAEVGQLAYLQVTAKTQFGAFLDFGLDRGLFLPFGEQRFPLQIGRRYLVYLYLDKSERISCTTDITKYLSAHSPYRKNDKVKGTIYYLHPEIGAFVAIDDQYQGLIPVNEYFTDLDNGDRVEGRVIRVREDGKLDLSLRDLAHKQVNTDVEIILQKMKQHHGHLPVDEKASPEEIEKTYHLSKAAFKRAIGSLLKSNVIIKTENGFILKQL